MGRMALHIIHRNRTSHPVKNFLLNIQEIHNRIAYYSSFFHRICIDLTNITAGAILRQDGSGTYDVKYVSSDEVPLEAQAWKAIRV